MRLLYITVRSDYGGGPKHVDILINSFYKKHHLFCAAPLNKPFGTKWINMIGSENFLILPYRKFSLFSLYKLLLFIKKNKIQIIHSHGKGAGLYSRIIGIISPKVKIVHTLHGFHIDEYFYFKRKLYVFLETIFAFFTDIFINVSYGEQKHCINSGLRIKNKSKVIYNGVKICYDYGLYNKKQHRRILSLPEDKFIIVTISRFDYPKNMWLACKIAEILKNNENIIFLWIGDGIERVAIQRYLKNNSVKNVFFTGFVDNVVDYLKVSDIYLSTSLWEGLPYSIIEALSLGIPAIVSDVIGNNEIINDSINGLLFKLNNINECVNKILTLYSNKKLYNKMSDNAINIYKERFTLDQMIFKTINIYNSYKSKL